MVQMLQLQVLNPRMVDESHQRRAYCELVIEWTKPLPTHTYNGTVHIMGQEQTVRGNYPCRLLRHYQVSWLETTINGAQYLLSIDVSDEALPTESYSPRRHSPNMRRVTEPIEVICRRVAGIFGRYCQDEYRPPTVIVR
jgi:hypothetical protein